MMGSDSEPGFPPSPVTEEAMETLALSDDPHRRSSGDLHPLSAVHGGDPLLHPTKTLLSPSSSSSFLDPPSYSDAVLSPFEFDPPNGLSPSPRPSRPRESHYSSISVSDPQKEQDPANANSVITSGAFVTYLIVSRPAAGSPESTVRRRFRDVVTLADRVAESYRGFFIPPRPDKSVVEGQVMQKQEFVEQRRAAVERYLRRLAEHPAVGKSEELRAFLQAPGRLPLPATTDVASRMIDGAVRLPKQLLGGEGGGCVAPQDVVQPAKGGRDLMRIFKELRQSVANDWGGGRPQVSEEDKEFLERKERVQGLEQQISTASQQAEALVKAQQDIGETMGELGLALIKVAKFEGEEVVYDTQRIRAAEMKRFATAAVKASRFYRELNAQTVKHLDTLHEYLGLMLAVHSAFSDRSSALLTVQTLLSDLSALHTKIEKLEAASTKTFGGDKSRIRKIEELKETIRITEDAKSCAVREYERIKENNRNEVERLDRERRDDFLAMLKGFVLNQVGYAEKLASVWSKVGEETSGFAAS